MCFASRIPIRGGIPDVKWSAEFTRLHFFVYELCVTPSQWASRSLGILQSLLQDAVPSICTPRVNSPIHEITTTTITATILVTIVMLPRTYCCTIPPCKWAFSPSNGEMGGRGRKKINVTSCQAPRLEQLPAGRHASSTYVNWSSQVTLVFIYRIFQLCMTNFAQSHYLKQFVSMWEATPSPSWKVGGENVIIHCAPAWIIEVTGVQKRK